MVEYGGFVSETRAELLKRCLMEWIEGIKGNGAISSNIKGSFGERKRRILWASEPQTYKHLNSPEKHFILSQQSILRVL